MLSKGVAILRKILYNTCMNKLSGMSIVLDIEDLAGSNLKLDKAANHCAARLSGNGGGAPRFVNFSQYFYCCSVTPLRPQSSRNELRAERSFCRGYKRLAHPFIAKWSRQARAKRETNNNQRKRSVFVVVVSGAVYREQFLNAIRHSCCLAGSQNTS